MSMKFFGRSYGDYVGKTLSVVSPIMPDKLYISLFYWLTFHRRINLKHPSTFNEKLQWLKLHDKHPEFTQLVDKYACREIVTRLVGKNYLIPLLGVWDSFEEIDFDALPNQFVLKTNHDSQGVVICKDKKSFNVTEARKKLTKCLKHNYFWNSREYPYKNVKRCIIAEQFMEDKLWGELRDYKFFCFNGKVEFLYVASGRQSGKLKFDFFDKNLKTIPVKQCHPNSDVVPELPHNIHEMIRIAEVLCQNYREIRIDLYNIEGKIYFGEFTIFHEGGLVPFEPKEYDEHFGKLISLPTDN